MTNLKFQFQFWASDKKTDFSHTLQLTATTILPTHFLFHFHFANFACPEAIQATEAEAAQAEAEAAQAETEAAQASDDDDEKDTNLHRRLLSVERKP